MSSGLFILIAWTFGGTLFSLFCYSDFASAFKAKLKDILVKIAIASAVAGVCFAVFHSLL